MSKNKETLDSFVEYCHSNPELRFWQALRNWSGNMCVLVSDHYKAEIFTYDQGVDTFYRKGRTK